MKRKEQQPSLKHPKGVQRKTQNQNGPYPSHVGGHVPTSTRSMHDCFSCTGGAEHVHSSVHVRHRREKCRTAAVVQSRRPTIGCLYKRLSCGRGRQEARFLVPQLGNLHALQVEVQGGFQAELEKLSVQETQERAVILNPPTQPSVTPGKYVSRAHQKPQQSTDIDTWQLPPVNQRHRLCHAQQLRKGGTKATQNTNRKSSAA